MIVFKQKTISKVNLQLVSAEQFCSKLSDFCEAQFHSTIHHKFSSLFPFVFFITWTRTSSTTRFYSIFITFSNLNPNYAIKIHKFTPIIYEQELSLNFLNYLTSSPAKFRKSPFYKALAHFCKLLLHNGLNNDIQVNNEIGNKVKRIKLY